MDHLTLLLGLTLLAPALAGCTAPDPSGPEAVRRIAGEAAGSIDTPEEARSAGYAPVGRCIPGVGVHWVNDRLLDGTLQARMPEAVLFEPTGEDPQDPTQQRFVGVAYMVDADGAEVNGTWTPPRLLDVPLAANTADHGPRARWVAELHVLLADDLDANGTLPSTASSIACPEEPKQGKPRTEERPARELPECDSLGGREVHEHAKLYVYLNSSEPYDFSPDRYQLAARPVHIEGGERDADGAIVHVHEARPTLACFLATLGWNVTDERIETDTGAVYEEDARHGIEIEVNGSAAPDGFETNLTHRATYEVRYTSARTGPV